MNRIEYVEITNNKNMKVVLSTLGASIYAIFINDRIMTLTPKSKSDFEKPFLYYGKTIGPIANRVRNGQIKIGNKKIQLDVNEKPNTLHSGKDGLSNQIFDNEMKETSEYKKVVFTYKNYTIAYTIFNNSYDLQIDFNVEVKEPTILGLTNHTFFTLGDISLNDLELRINADKYVKPNDIDLVPESVQEVDEIMDFRKNKPILQEISSNSLQNVKARGYDHHYIFADESKPQISLSSNAIELNIETDFSGCQIYSDNYEDNVEMFNTHFIKNRAIAIEPQDSTLERPIYRQNETYKIYIKYRFSVK